MSAMSTISATSLIFLLFLVNGNCDNAPSVIIVGAGPAGIAAAARLLENGISNVTILEAEGRIGGRIHSVQFGDAMVDLGAEWCHGEIGNVVYETVKDFNLLKPTEFSDTFYSSSREPIDQNLANELYALGERIYYNESSEEEVSLGEYITKKYMEAVTKKYGNDEKKQKFAWEILNTFKSEVLSVEGAFSWSDPAANSHYKDCEGQNLNWQGRGYKTILDVLMKSYPDPDKKLPVIDKIIVNKEVTEIVWDNTSAESNKRVTVKCSDNSEYIADHVILTVSLGVLKNRCDTLFSPTLPQEKINAIEELGIGAVAKVFIHFPEKWWPDDNFTNIILHWQNNDRDHLFQEFPNGPNDNGQSWLGDLTGFLTVEKNPNVLVAWFAGKFVPQIELISDDMVIDGILFILNKFVSHQFNITKPGAILRYNWYTNPHFRGTYSFTTLRSRERKVPGAAALLKPLTSSSGKQTLLFAGEATNPIHYATVHGAIETGYREAHRIINFYK